MTIQPRAQRWPSAWQLHLNLESPRSGGVTVQIRNVSTTGCAFVAQRPVSVGVLIRCSVGGSDVTGRIVRSGRNGGAIRFDTPISPHQLAILRQVRQLHGSAPPEAAIRQAISAIL